jgi:hypothetical protein
MSDTHTLALTAEERFTLIDALMLWMGNEEDQIHDERALVTEDEAAERAEGLTRARAILTRLGHDWQQEGR